MEKECMNCGGSIYFQCRKEAAKYNDRLSSREGASEMLNVSVSSLSNYELGLTPVPTDVVVRMADLCRSHTHKVHDHHSRVRSVPWKALWQLHVQTSCYVPAQRRPG